MARSESDTRDFTRHGARCAELATRITPADPRPVLAAAVNMRACVRACVRACACVRMHVRANDAKMSRIGIEGSMQGQVRFRLSVGRVAVTTLAQAQAQAAVAQLRLGCRQAAATWQFLLRWTRMHLSLGRRLDRDSVG